MHSHTTPLHIAGNYILTFHEVLKDKTQPRLRGLPRSQPGGKGAFRNADWLLKKYTPKNHTII